MTNWNSWADFWHLGGYGLYVWGSYAVTLLALATEGHFAARRHRRARAALADAELPQETA